MCVYKFNIDYCCSNSKQPFDYHLTYCCYLQGVIKNLLQHLKTTVQISDVIRLLLLPVKSKCNVKTRL